MELYPNSEISNPRQGNKTGILKKILIVIYNFDIGVSPQESFFI